MNYKNCFIQAKPYPLRDAAEWTVHVDIERDTRDGVEHLKKIETGRRFASESEAIEFGEATGMSFVDAM